MSVITLTTDFGIKDHYSGSVKGALFNELGNVNIVDISHNVSPFNIIEAAYIIENAYKNFPEGSIHIIGVDSEKNPEQNHLAVKLDGHYFICADNGIMSLLSNKINPEKIVEINIHNNIISTFSAVDIFVKIAAHIYRGGSIDLVGKQKDNLKELYNINPILNEKNKEIIGNVIYVDNYENVVTNISKKLFQEFGKSQSFEINARNYKFKEIVKKYNHYFESLIVVNDCSTDNTSTILSDLSESNKNIVPQIMLIPLLAFDNKKFRLGYGKGYYDIFLKLPAFAVDLLASQKNTIILKITRELIVAQIRSNKREGDSFSSSIKGLSIGDRAKLSLTSASIFFSSCF